MLTCTSFKTFNELYTFPKIYSEERTAQNIALNIFVTLATEQKNLEDTAFRNKS